MAANTSGNSRAVVPVLDDNAEELRHAEGPEADDTFPTEQVSHPVDLRVGGHIIHRETMIFSRTDEANDVGDFEEKGAPEKMQHGEEKHSVFSAFNNAIDSEVFEDTVKYETGWRLKLKNFMLTPSFTVVVMLLTLYALLGLSISEAAYG